MALAKAVQGARHTAVQITWTHGGLPVDLTGATITGYKKNMDTGVVTALDGTTAVGAGDTATDGEFTWTRGAADVATVGIFLVHFVAEFGASDQEKSFVDRWEVVEAYDDEV